MRTTPPVTFALPDTRGVVGRRCGGASGSLAPHFLQNLSLSLLTAPQLGQVFAATQAVVLIISASSATNFA